MNKVMLVAGGSGSVGNSLAALAAMAGWTVAVHGRRQVRVDSTLAHVLGQMPLAHVTGHLADFALTDAFPALIADVMHAHGRIDAVVDCSVAAPPGIAGGFAATAPDQYTRSRTAWPIAARHGWKRLAVAPGWVCPMLTMSRD